jgi:hypothetical protein
MSFLEAVDVYFKGEKSLAMVLIPLGILLLGLGVWLWRWYGGGLGKGMGIPLAVVGLGMVVGAPIFINTVSNRVERLERSFKEDARAPVVEEVARMKKVNANWPILKGAWAVLIGVALLLLFTVKKDWVTGLALALTLICAMVMIVDVFAERRAEIYADRLVSSQ